MTEEELREKLTDILCDYFYTQLPCGDTIDQILTLIRDAGYRSPEEVDKMVEHRIYEMYANETYQP